MSTQIFKVTSFATPKDLFNMVQCLVNGGTEDRCLSVGDNGIGAFGDIIYSEHLASPACAISTHEMVGRWGSTHAARARAISVQILPQGGNPVEGHGKPFLVYVMDIAPNGVIDLTPSALLAAGLPHDYELSSTCSWRWADDIEPAV